MDDAERQKRAEATYGAIGRYIVVFSEMLGFMRLTLGERLKRPEDHPHIIDRAFGDANPTHITNAFFAVARAVLDNEDEREIGRMLRTRVIRRIEERNKIAHGDWLAGASTHYKHTTGEKIPLSILITTRAAREPSRNVEMLSAAQIEKWTDSLRELSLMVAEFGLLALDQYQHIADEPMRVSDIFHIDGPKKKRVVSRSGPKAAQIKYGY